MWRQFLKAFYSLEPGSGVGRAALVFGRSSFRAEKHATAQNKSSTMENRVSGRRKPRGSAALSPTDVMVSVSRQHGYKQAVIEQAYEIYGPVFTEVH